MKIAIDADKNGENLKKMILTHLAELGHKVEDLSYLRYNGDRDYPDVPYNLAIKIQSKEFERGILICGTGLGMAIMANKISGVYAGTCNDVYAAERLQKGNNAQVLTLGAKVVGEESAKLICEAFVRSKFQGGGSLPKFSRIQEIENEIKHDNNSK